MAAHTHAHAEEHVDHTHHVVPLSLYMKVFGALMVLLVITLLAAMKDFGPWNLVIAMIIAVAKAVLVVQYFMHLKFSTKLVRFMGVAALFWIVLLFGITMADYIARGWVKV